MEWSFSKQPALQLPLEDEVIKGPWLSHVLQMANKYYTPTRLEYRPERAEDVRIKYMTYFLDVRGQRVLEIGPYEAAQSIILEKMGVDELVLVESRPENVAKCQRIKEKYHLDKTKILLQDIEKIYNGQEPAKFSGTFDLVFCVGVLYHLPNPAKALEWFQSLAPTLFLGTHYICAELPQYYRHMPPMVLDYNGQRYAGGEWREGGASDLLSGMSELSFWAKEEDLIRMLHAAGYKNVSVLGKDILGQYPHITILAQR